jgi:hypothetical protein
MCEYYLLSGNKQLFLNCPRIKGPVFALKALPERKGNCCGSTFSHNG